MTLKTLVVDPRVHSAMVSDCLDAIGIRNNVMDSSIQPLDSAMRAVGHAATILFEPNADFDQQNPYADGINFLDTLQPGELAVVATGGDSRSAFWGELFSAAAKGRGATGVVCDGPIRDVGKIISLEFPAFAAGARPIDYKGRMRVVATRCVVVCGGVEIFPGDAVIADSDGIAVVPAANIDKVFYAANTKAQSEKLVLRDLLSGRSVREVWNTYGVL
jgi:4-hydroxy-4-methyl-2-oxoglutarate aldolase